MQNKKFECLICYKDVNMNFLYLCEQCNKEICLLCIKKIYNNKNILFSCSFCRHPFNLNTILTLKENNDLYKQHLNIDFIPIYYSWVGLLIYLLIVFFSYISYIIIKNILL